MFQALNSPGKCCEKIHFHWFFFSTSLQFISPHTHTHKYRQVVGGGGGRLLFNHWLHSWLKGTKYFKIDLTRSQPAIHAQQYICRSPHIHAPKSPYVYIYYQIIDTSSLCDRILNSSGHLLKTPMLTPQQNVPYLHHHHRTLIKTVSLTTTTTTSINICCITLLNWNSH